MFFKRKKVVTKLVTPVDTFYNVLRNTLPTGFKVRVSESRSDTYSFQDCVTVEVRHGVTKYEFSGKNFKQILPEMVKTLKEFAPQLEGLTESGEIRNDMDVTEETVSTTQADA